MTELAPKSCRFDNLLRRLWDRLLERTGTKVAKRLECGQLAAAFVCVNPPQHPDVASLRNIRRAWHAFGPLRLCRTDGVRSKAAASWPHSKRFAASPPERACSLS
jgi:hypothetical protein